MRMCNVINESSAVVCTPVLLSPIPPKIDSNGPSPLNSNALRRESKELLMTAMSIVNEIRDVNTFK